MHDQPPPIGNGHRPMWDAVIDDMLERNAVGIERYGVPLQPFNGRAAIVDAYQEGLDLVVYLRQAHHELQILVEQARPYLLAAAPRSDSRRAKDILYDLEVLAGLATSPLTGYDSPKSD